MANEFKEIIMHIRKGVTSSIRISYRSVRAHPYISGLLFLLLILYKAFPSVLAFLISYSPVIICTAILLGTLLSYGTSNIPEIEEEIKKAQKISSLQMGSSVDDVVMKKDENFTVETHLETDTAVNERATQKAAGEASNSCSNEREKEENREQGEIVNREFSLENQAELAEKLDLNVNNVAVNDLKELEGLRVQIAKPLSDSPFDSSLGSPWQPVDKFDAPSNSDSDSGESSSPDASMTDIIPMLDELHPLLDSELPQPTLIADDDSDSSSSSSSRDHESDDEVKNEDSKEKDDKNEESVPWTEDDQKNVMDLGYSEEERNRRLENLIAKRRLRKLQSQRYEIERNLIDFDNFYPSPIPPISAPRRNPFDILYSSDSNVPASAPSILQPRQNPFDFPHDQVEEVTILSNEFLNHNDFISTAQRERLSRFHESSIGGPSFLGDSRSENKGSKLNPFFDTERSELIHPEIQQESPTMSPISIDFTTTDMEETYQDASNLGEEIGKGEGNAPASGTGKLEMIEERYEDSDSSLSEENEKISGVHIREEESADLDQENPDYDSDPSAMRRTQTDILTLDEALLYEGRKNTTSNPLPSDVREDFSEVASLPRPFEANVLLKDRDSTVVKTKEENLVESSDLSMVNEDESKLREIYGIEENDVKQVGIPSEEAGRIMNSSTFSSVDTESSEDHSVNVDNSIQSEGYVMINEPATEESLIRPSPGSDVEESQMCAEEIGDSGAIDISETMKFSTLWENKSGLEISSQSDLGDSQSKITDEISSKNSGEFLKNLDESNKESDDEVRPEIHESLLSELDAVSDFSVERRLKSNVVCSEVELGQFETVVEGSTTDIQDSRVYSIKDADTGYSDPEMTVYNPKLHVLEACSIEELDSVFKEHHEEASDLITENSINSETEKGLSEHKPFVTDIELQVLEAKSVEDNTSALKNHSEDLGETSISQSETFEIKPEEIKSELHVLEAKSVEDITSALNNHSVGLSETSISQSETSENKPEEINSELHVLEAKSVEDITSALKNHSEDLGEISISQSETSEIKPEEINSELLVLEAKSVEDISSALKNLSEGLGETSISQSEALEIQQERIHLEPEEEINSDLQALEAKSVEDTRSALKQFSEAKSEILEIQTEKRQLEPEEINSDLHILEAKSLEDINLALKQVSGVNVESSSEQMKHDDHLENEASQKELEPEHIEVKSAEEMKLDSTEAKPKKTNLVTEENSENSSESATTKKKSRKNKKSSNSGTDSSSSSSSSSSDSE